MRGMRGNLLIARNSLGSLKLAFIVPICTNFMCTKEDGVWSSYEAISMLQAPHCRA